MTTREDARDGPASEDGRVSKNGPASERRERPADDEIERLFGSLPHVLVSQLGDDENEV